VANDVSDERLAQLKQAAVDAELLRYRRAMADLKDAERRLRGVTRKLLALGVSLEEGRR
jgi:hypothetical protein